MNTEPEILNNDTESKLDQPKTADGSLPFLQSISLLSTLYKWAPTGYRVVINLPLISNDIDYVFLVRFGPFIPHYTEMASLYSNPMAVNAERFMKFINFDRTNAPGTTLPLDSAVKSTQYALPPLLSILTHSYRRWRGDIEYRFRVASNFGNQGIIGTTPLYNIMPCSNTTWNPYRTPATIMKKDDGYLTTFTNSYQYQDASMFRHAEMRMKYQKPVEWVDHFAELTNLLTYYDMFGDGIGFPLNNRPSLEDYVGVFLKGTLPNNANTNQIEIEIDYRACENFEFSGENVFPNLLSDKFVNKGKQQIASYNPKGGTGLFGNVLTTPNDYTALSTGTLPQAVNFTG